MIGLVLGAGLVFAGLQVVPIVIMQREHAAFQERLVAKAKSALEVSFLDPRASLTEDIGKLLKDMGAEFAPEHIQVDFEARTRKLSAQVWYARRHGSPFFKNPQPFYAKLGGLGASGEAPSIPQPSRPLELTDANFSHEALTSATPVMVMFWAPWCGYCQKALPSIDEASRTFAGKMVMAKLNTDDYRETAARYGVRGLPTFVFFKQGKVVARIPGWPGHDGLMSTIQQHL